MAFQIVYGIPRVAIDEVNEALSTEKVNVQSAALGRTRDTKGTDPYSFWVQCFSTSVLPPVRGALVLQTSQLAATTNAERKLNS